MLIAKDIPRMLDPIFNVVEKHVDDLHPNSWNPNVVMNPELKLLEESILSYGWIHPVIANQNGMIIDGYHRWFLNKTSKKLLAKYEGMTPCVILDIDDAEATMMTVRMNRAKGVHAALRMSELVQTLIDEHGIPLDDLKKKMGMTDNEIGLLYDGSLLKRRNLQDRKYSKAWVPVETKLLSEQELKELENQNGA